METRIALLRGINVGGRTVLPMKELVRELEDIGLENVRTYIQSGNVVFQCAKKTRAATLADRIGQSIEKIRGFKPAVLVLTNEQLKRAITANPFPEAEAEPKTVHLCFLASAPSSPEFEALEAVKTSTERFELIDDVFYLHTPDGFGRSKLPAKVEKCLGVSATARNWRTVLKIQELAQQL